MLKSLLILLLLAAPDADAAQWKQIYACNDLGAVIDYNEDEGDTSLSYTHQLVIRLPNAVRHIRATGAIPPSFVNRKDEIIVPLVVNRNARGLKFEFIGETEALKADGRVYYVKPQTGGLMFEAYETTANSMGVYMQKRLVTEWYFDKCSVVH